MSVARTCMINRCFLVFFQFYTTVTVSLCARPALSSLRNGVWANMSTERTSLATSQMSAVVSSVDSHSPVVSISVYAPVIRYVPRWLAHLSKGVYYKSVSTGVGKT